MIEGLIGLGAVVVVQFGLLWYKLGRVEGILKEHCRQNNHSKKGKRG